MACENILESYAKWKAENEVKPGVTQALLDAKWIEALRLQRSGVRLAAINAVLATNNESLQIPVGYNTEARAYTKNATMLDIDAMENGNYMLFTHNGSYEFAPRSKISVPTKSGGKVKYLYAPSMSQVFTQKEYGREALRSSADIDQKVNWDKFTQLEEDIHGNPAKMVELLDKLNEIDGNATSEDMMKHYRDLIGSMDPKFFTKMKTYIKETAKTTGGVVEHKEIGVMLNKEQEYNRNDQTAAEAYAHEIVHAYVRFAVSMGLNGDPEAYRIVKELQHVMLKAKQDTKWQDFLESKEADATAAEIKNAKDMYTYIFDSEHAEQEFIAHVLTNPMVMRKTKRIKLHENKPETVWAKIKELFNDIVGYLLGEYAFKNRTKNVYNITTELAMRFAELNNRKVNEARNQESILGRLANEFNDLDIEVGETLSAFVDQYLPKIDRIGPRPEGVIENAKWTARLLGKVILDPRTRKHALAYLDQIGLLSAIGSARSIINDLIESDEVQKAVDWLALGSDKIDQNRMNLITTTKGLIRDGFKTKPTKAEEELMTLVLLDTDMQVLVDKYTNRELRKLLENENILDREINRVKRELEALDGNNYGWHVNQAMGLGYTLATGKQHIVQNMNAKNIARGIMSEHLKKPWVKKRGDLTELIDELATLSALRYTDETAKQQMAAYMTTEYAGVKNVLETARFLRDEAGKTIFKDQEIFMIKGYTKELFDNGIEMEVAPIAKKEEMENAGYKLVKKLENHSLVTVKEEYGLYVSKMFQEQGYQRAATRLTKQHTKGTSLKDIYYDENDELSRNKHKINVKKINIERHKLVKQMMDGELDFTTLEYGLAPIIDDEGNVTSYRYMMDKESKRNYLQQNTTLSEVMGATRGTMIDKMQSVEHNKKVLDMIKKDNEENYRPGENVGENGLTYVLIKDGTGNEKIQDLWNMLPKEFKQYALKDAEQGLPVRKDLLNNLFGYRHASLSNFPWLEKYMPHILKEVIKMAESIWMEFIKIVKVDILFKIPMVLVGNIFSNILYAINTGSSPVEILSMYRNSFQNVKAYLKYHKEWIKLKELEGIGKLTVEQGKKIAMLEKILKANPIHEMYEKGMYQAIVEDASQEELSATNGIKKWYNERTSSVPKVIKDGMNWMYLTEETQYYKFMTEVLQISDLIARDVEKTKSEKMQAMQASGEKPLPAWYIKDLQEGESDMARAMRMKFSTTDLANKKRKMSGEERKYFNNLATEQKWNYLLNAFVNYNKTSGPVEEYLNKMGMIMFTKYAKRIQRVIAETGIKYPLKTIALLMGDNLIVDYDLIQEQSMFTRSWYNITPKMPWERLADVFTPPIAQLAGVKII